MLKFLEIIDFFRDILDKMPERRLQLSDVQVYVDPLDATQEYTGFEIF